MKWRRTRREKDRYTTSHASEFILRHWAEGRWQKIKFEEVREALKKFDFRMTVPVSTSFSCTALLVSMLNVITDGAISR